MKLPNAENAVIRTEKISGYLLNLSHPDGQGKANFFIKKCGFPKDDPEILKEALLKQATLHEVAKVVENPFGVKYIIEGTIQAPIGTMPLVLSVWIIENNKEYPELVTAYPI